MLFKLLFLLGDCKMMLVASAVLLSLLSSSICKAFCCDIFWGNLLLVHEYVRSIFMIMLQFDLFVHVGDLLICLFLLSLVVVIVCVFLF